LVWCRNLPNLGRDCREASHKYLVDIVYRTTGYKAYAIVTRSAKVSFWSQVQIPGTYPGHQELHEDISAVLVIEWILIVWTGGFYHHLTIATSDHNFPTIFHGCTVLFVCSHDFHSGSLWWSTTVQELTAIQSLTVSARGTKNILQM
jgi:hypothetical protein